jgi:PAS domain S-box-containing protein
MESQLENPAEEIKRLQRCLSDLVSIQALPAIWSGADPPQIVRTLLDSLLAMLNLDLVYVRLKELIGDGPIEMARIARSTGLPPQPQAIGEMLSARLGNDVRDWPALTRGRIGETDLSIVPMRLGLQGDIGIIVAGSHRPDFPNQTEKLLLSVAANETAIGLQGARILGEQRRVSKELDQRVEQRTAELAAANEALKKEIAERRLMEEKLRLEEKELKRSEARKAAIMDSALDCIVTIDHEARITEFNPAAERTFGYQSDAVVGRPMADVIIPPALRSQHLEGLSRYLATGESRMLGKRLEMTALRADGSEFPVELAITRIPLDGPPSFTGYLRDITERKRSEESLRRSEAYLAEAQKLSLTGSFGWDVSSDEHFGSDETFRIFGYEISTRVTVPLILDRVHPQDVALVRQSIARAASGEHLDYQCRLLMPNGSVKYVHIVGHGSRDQEGRLEYIGAVQDVTQRRLSEEALGTVRSELARVARVTSLGALTASIAHEVNQPLSGIITNASTCLRMLAADPPNVDGARETARRTIRDGNRASDVIARLRALFSKRDATPESVDLNEATREVIALSMSNLQRGRVTLRQELADELPPVTGDRVQFQQVILNLLLNACDAMSAVEDRPRELAIATHTDGEGRVRLSVRDTGAGLQSAGADKLFEAFYTTKHNGMGIGLFVSRSIIESHRGRLWASPNDGPGATFSFSIPSAFAGVTGAHKPGAVPESSDAPQQRTGRVL